MYVCMYVCMHVCMWDRSYFQPVRCVVDGELCERFTSLSYTKQKEFADDVDRSVADGMHVYVCMCIYMLT